MDADSFSFIMVGECLCVLKNANEFAFAFVSNELDGVGGPSVVDATAFIDGDSRGLKGDSIR